MLKDNRVIIFIVLLLLATFTSFLFRPPVVNVQVNDWWQYNAYAESLAAGHGYTMNSVNFDDFREPGYPVFLAFIYHTFGVKNFTATIAVQIVLLAITAFLVYVIFELYGERTWGRITAGIVAILPSYGHLTNMIESEPLFVPLLAALFFCSVDLYRRIDSHQGERRGTMLRWGLLGALTGIMVLTRVQTLFFLPFLLFVGFLVLWRKKAPMREALLGAGGALLISIVIIGSWVLYVHSQKGVFALTEGRIEVSLYNRSIRSELSYGQLTQYALEYVRYGMTNADFSPPSFYMLEPFYLSSQYNKLVLAPDKLALLATSTDARTGYIPVTQNTASSSLVHAEVKKDIGIIEAHPGQYLYGTGIEAMKLFYTDPVFYFIENSLVRRLVYIQWILAYALCVFGLWQSFKALYRKQTSNDSKSIATLGLIAALFILYNVLVLPWLEVTPRYNTPYMMFYYIIGAVGFILWRRRRAERSI